MTLFYSIQLDTLFNRSILYPCSIENRQEMADQLFLFKLLYVKVHSSRLIERISLHVSNVYIRSQEPFLLPSSRSNFLRNDPLVRATRFLNNCNFDIFCLNTVFLLLHYLILLFYSYN